MAEETAATAVTKLRIDLPDVTSRDLGAAQGAMGIRARGLVIDKNEAEHVGPPPGTGFLVKTQRDFHRRLLLMETRLDRQLFPDRHLVIGCVRPSAGKAALGRCDVAAPQRQRTAGAHRRLAT